LLKKRDQHVIRAAKELLKKNLDLNVESNPEISINNKSVQEVKTRYKINNNEKNILLGIGGSGTTKRIPAIIFIKLMHLITKKYKCKFFLATGKDNQEQKILKEILDTEFKNECYALDNLDLTEILPIIKNCDISICNDSSFSHLSSGLGIKTIVLMADTPLLYGSYSPRMYPIIPDGEITVMHNTFGKDRINPIKIFDQLDRILS
jgi:heptosyltransferase-2